MPNIPERLRRQGIQPSPQRLAVARALLESGEHLGAEEVLARARVHLPTLSRATVYNSLHLFAARGLVSELVLHEGRVLYDPLAEPHHHFVDESSGEVRDLPRGAVDVRLSSELAGYEIRQIHVVLRGRPVAPRLSTRTTAKSKRKKR